jgi:hypothetical protein
MGASIVNIINSAIFRPTDRLGLRKQPCEGATWQKSLGTAKYDPTIQRIDVGSVFRGSKKLQTCSRHSVVVASVKLKLRYSSRIDRSDHRLLSCKKIVACDVFVNDIRIHHSL